MRQFRYSEGFVYAELTGVEAIVNLIGDMPVYYYAGERIREASEQGGYLEDNECDGYLLLIAGEKELQDDYQEAVARNNENRSFESWLISKIE